MSKEGQPITMPDEQVETAPREATPKEPFFGNKKIDRRDFLRLAGFLGVSGVVAACAPQATPEAVEAVETALRLVTATPQKQKEVKKVVEKVLDPTTEPTAALQKEKKIEEVVEPTVEPSPTPTEVKPTVTPTVEVKPEATPTAPAVDVRVEIEEKYKEENPEVEAVSPIAFGGVAMASVWPEEMAKRVAKEFVHFKLNIQELPLEVEGKTRVLVSLEDEMAGAELMPWQPEEEEERQETLAIFSSLLPQALGEGEGKYLITQEIEEEAGTREEALHLAVYRNKSGEVERLVVPFVTQETLGEEQWKKIRAHEAAGQVKDIITGIETREIEEEEKEIPVMIFLTEGKNEKGEEVLKELLRIDLAQIELTQEERKRAKGQGLASFARFAINEGEYTFYRGEEGIVEEEIKLWEIPEELREEEVVEPEPTPTPSPESYDKHIEQFKGHYELKDLPLAEPLKIEFETQGEIKDGVGITFGQDWRNQLKMYNFAVGYEQGKPVIAVMSIENQEKGWQGHVWEEVATFEEKNKLEVRIEKGRVEFFLNDKRLISLGERFNLETGAVDFWSREEAGIKADIRFFAPQEYLDKLTPTPAPPTATPKPTKEAITPPEAPAGQICGVGRSEGQCYERTEMRKGILPNGHVEPDGTLARYVSDPDINVSGKWMLGGRVERIEGNNVIYLRARGEDIIKIRILYGSPGFYARMHRWLFGVPWEEAMPEVHPVLNRDILVGDYLNIALYAGDDNRKTTDQNYQEIISIFKKDGIVSAYMMEIFQ